MGLVILLLMAVTVTGFVALGRDAPMGSVIESEELLHIDRAPVRAGENEEVVHAQIDDESELRAYAAHFEGPGTAADDLLALADEVDFDTTRLHAFYVESGVRVSEGHAAGDRT